MSTHRRIPLREANFAKEKANRVAYPPKIKGKMYRVKNRRVWIGHVPDGVMVEFKRLDEDGNVAYLSVHLTFGAAASITDGLTRVLETERALRKETRLMVERHIRRIDREERDMGKAFESDKQPRGRKKKQS